MRRRTFLAAGLGALASRWARRAGPDHDHLRGGLGCAGPAGLSCAIELAERGVPVAVFEAGSQLGGKAKGWQDALDGTAVDVEHGIHGWWHQYVHFHDLLTRYALDGGLRKPRRSENGMRLADGQRGAGFVSRASLFIRAANARGHGFFPTQYRAGRRWLRKQGLADLRARLGGKSVAEWTADDPPLTVYSVFDRMMAWSM